MSRHRRRAEPERPGRRVGPLAPWPDPVGQQPAEVTNRVHPFDVLVSGIASKESAAFSDLYSLAADRLFAFAARMLGDHHESEDAVQQAFLELARTDSPPDSGRRLEAWLFTSVRFTCLDTLRARARRPAVPTDHVPEIDHVDRYEFGLDTVLESALSHLTAQQRAVLHLKHIEGLDGEGIAEILDITRMAVYATAARGERRLRQLLQLTETASLLSPTPGIDDA